jgi:hypothetical protein
VTMNSVDTFKKRLREEITAVEQAIRARNQQVEALSKRLEGLKRADELFDSDHAAIVELLQATLIHGSGTVREMVPAPPIARERAAASPKARGAQKQPWRNTHIGGGKPKTRRNARSATQNGGLTRVDMIATVLRRHPRRSVRELIALLDKEHRWKANESAVTGKLYTRRDKFVRTQPDRSTNRPVTWSLK